MKKKQISAEIVADSINAKGDRITTMIFTLPRIVLAELNTHRALAKNSASSRAIPFAKMRDMVLNDPFIPIAWQKDHKGMQGTEYFTDEHVKNIPGNPWHYEGDTTIVNQLKVEWLEARNQAVIQSEALDSLNLTKQLCNRMLEPYMWHTVIITGTEWENFFALRAHPQAEIHIAKLAEEALAAMNQSTPKSLKEGEWHVPFGDTFDDKRLLDPTSYGYNDQNTFDGIPSGWYIEGGEEEYHKKLESLKIKVATARCARISYNNFEGKDDYEADIKLHDVLLTSGHMSPFEHIAQCSLTVGRSGNFSGWIQYRKMIPNESQTDSRLIKKEYGENMDKS